MTDFWKSIDSAVSLLAAQAGVSVASWTLARPVGSSEYHVIVKQGGKFVDFPPAPGHPVASWLSSMGLSAPLLNDMATQAATEMIADARWTPVREPEKGWIRGGWRRPSPQAWEWDDTLSHIYWSSASKGQGLSDHAWLADLRRDLSSPVEPASRRRVLGALARVLSSYESWETRSGLSLRAWSVADPAWQDVLDQAGVDYAARDEGIPLLVAALANEKARPEWRRVLAGSLDYRLDLVLPPSDIPSSWWDERRQGEAPSAPLWCWAAGAVSGAAWEMLLAARPELLSAVDSDGCSALHWAAMSGNAEVAEILLNRGSNPAAENHAGLLPEEVVPSGKDALYERLATLRLARPRPSV